jgi:hypothetical protein
MRWVNRVGMLLEFLSLWLAAPELLGEERLKAWGRQLERWLQVIVVMLWFLLFAFLWAAVSDAMPDEVVAAMPTITFTVATAILSVVCALPLILSIEMNRKVIRPLQKRLTDDGRVRSRCLALGALLFMLGFLLRLVATFPEV